MVAQSMRDGEGGDCDLVGIGRPACLVPDLPRSIILNPRLPDEDAVVAPYSMRGAAFWQFVLGGGQSSSPHDSSSHKKHSAQSSGIPLVGASVATWWHSWQMCRIGRGADPDPQMRWMLGGLLTEGLFWAMLFAVGWADR